MKKFVLPLMGAALAVFASTAFAAGEVKLQQAFSIVSSKYGQSQQSMNFEANVSNLNYTKQVFARVRDGNGVWTDIPLSFNRTAEAGREIWSTSYGLPVNTTFDAQFALKYVVNGQTYWDNNSGQNYSIAKDTGSILGSGMNVYNESFKANVNLGVGNQTYSGFITVRNLGEAKTLRVHYSTNNWASKTIVNATRSTSPYSGRYSSAVNPNQYGFEDWSYSLNIGNATQLVYAVEYVVNGQTYWDNNYGKDYRVTITRQ